MWWVFKSKVHSQPPLLQCPVLLNQLKIDFFKSLLWQRLDGRLLGLVSEKLLR